MNEEFKSKIFDLIDDNDCSFSDLLFTEDETIKEYIEILKSKGGKNMDYPFCKCCGLHFDKLNDVMCIYKPNKIYKTCDCHLCDCCVEILLDKRMPISKVEDYDSKLTIRDGELILPLINLCFNEWREDYCCPIADYRFFDDWTPENDIKWKKLLT